jgi:hypothetical protein
MNIRIRFGATLLVIITLAGCTSMAEYDASIAKDGSFAADDRQFAVNPLDYPVFALKSSDPKQHPEVGTYQGPTEMTTDILPSDRWEITRLVYGRYLAYSVAYGVRYCKAQLSDRKFQSLVDRCSADGQKYASFYIYFYIQSNGSLYGWQQVNNQDRAPFEKTWFKVRDKGDWSGQPWFKCIERCDKQVNMK